MKLLIYGSSDFGKLVKKLVVESGYEFAGYIDDFNQSSEILGDYNLIRKNYSHRKFSIVIAIGSKFLAERKAIIEKIRVDGYDLPNIVHKTAYIASDVDMGVGCIVMAKAIIDYNTIVRDGVVLWPGSIVNHNCTIGQSCYIAPNATVCGFATLGKNCFVGAGAVIVDHTEVADNSFVNANSIYKTGEKH